MKRIIISEIKRLTVEASTYGFDNPYIPASEDNTTQELMEFLVELSSYIAYNRGYNDAIKGEELVETESPWIV